MSLDDKLTYQELPPNFAYDVSKPRCGAGLPWQTKDFTAGGCQGQLTNTATGDIIVRGSVSDTSVQSIMFWAAAPPTFGTSFSGSGMPYPNPVVAYDRTPNKGTVPVNGGKFEFRIKYPNAYYIGLGSLYVPPHVSIKPVRGPGSTEGEPSMIVIDDGIPFRMLTWPAPPSKKPRVTAMFYCEPSNGVRTQEAILRGAGYPEVNKTPDNFWGTKPPR